MAHIRLPDPKPGLKTGTASLEKYNDLDTVLERLLLVLAQIDALVRIAMQGDLSQHSEAVFYHYLTVIGEQVAELKVVCEWLVSRALPAPVQASTGDA